MSEKTYFVYIVASRSRTLYVGVTSNLFARMFQHRNKQFEGFSADYNCNRLVWYESYSFPDSAIAREKQIKGWRREKKIGLIEQLNPQWIDLSEAWTARG